MSILSSYIRELEFSRRKDTGKMALKQRKRFFIFLYILFLPDIGYDFNWEEKNKEYLPP